jgi:hypothetical protein
MRDFRHLPPLLRVASILGLLFPLASIELFAVVFAPTLSSLPVGSFRVLMIALNLLLLGWACSFAVRTYSARFRQPGGGPFPLDSWQSQVRAIVLLSALPLGALAVALVIPPTSRAFQIVFPISILGACVLIVAEVVYAANSGPMRTPRAQ